MTELFLHRQNYPLPPVDGLGKHNMHGTTGGPKNLKHFQRNVVRHNLLCFHCEFCTCKHVVRIDNIFVDALLSIQILYWSCHVEQHG